MNNKQTEIRRPDNGLPPYYITYITDGFSYYQQHIWIVDGIEEREEPIQISEKLYTMGIGGIK